MKTVFKKYTVQRLKQPIMQRNKDMMCLLAEPLIATAVPHCPLLYGKC